MEEKERLRWPVYGLTVSLRNCPGGLGQATAHIAILRGFVGAGIAVKPALVNPLRDGGEPEDRKSQIKIPVLNLVSASAFTIGSDISVFSWNARRSIIQAHNGTLAWAVEMIKHAIVGKVC